MKKGIHPEVHDVTARCACGYSISTRSTESDIRTTLCSNCHPFYTGTQKFVDTAGRIEKFAQRYQKAAERAAHATAAQQKPAPKKAGAKTKKAAATK